MLDYLQNHRPEIRTIMETWQFLYNPAPQSKGAYQRLPIYQLYSQWELIAQSDFALWDVAFINSDTGFMAGEDENNYSNFTTIVKFKIKHHE